MDLVLISRIQFALTAAFHYLYPPITIGLGVILVIMEAIYLITGKEIYKEMTQFWAKIFGLTFALGVATGIVLEFEFGTNWAEYSKFVGDVFGSALAAEGIFAFFLESGFLAIVLFGWNRVHRYFHFFATLMVSLGAMFSAVWIIVANSWMQTPAGYHLVNHQGVLRAEITDFWAMVFNPSSMDRLSHTLMGAWQSGAWLVLSVSAYYLVRKKYAEFAQKSFKIALVIAFLASLGQVVTGHSSAVGVSKHQPAKLAAMEAVFAEKAPGNLYLFGWVHEAEKRVLFGVAVPKLLSYLIHGDWNAPITGLDTFNEGETPPVQIVFQTYHLMVMIGVFLLGLSTLGLVLWWRKKLFHFSRLLWVYVVAVILPQIGNQIGWMVAEIGRQPWIVYGELKTSEGVSKVVSSAEVLTSTLLFLVIYILLFALFIYLLDHKIRTGPKVLKSTEKADYHLA